MDPPKDHFDSHKKKRQNSGKCSNIFRKSIFCSGENFEFAGGVHQLRTWSGGSSSETARAPGDLPSDDDQVHGEPCFSIALEDDPDETQRLKDRNKGLSLGVSGWFKKKVNMP